MSLISSEWRFIVRRSLAHWRLLSTIIIGVLVAVALISSIPLYSNAINDFGLSRALRDRHIEALDLHVYAQYDLVNYENYCNEEAFVNQQVSQNAGSIIRQEETWIRSQTYYVGLAGKPLSPRPFRPTGYFHVFSNLEKHITVVEGEYSVPPRSDLSREELEDPEFTIEGMIGSETADIFGVGVGDRLIVHTDDGLEQKRITVELTAIIDPIDPREEYWLLKTDVFTVAPPMGEEAGPPVAPIFIPEETLFEIVSRLIPDTEVSYNWFYFVDLDRINSLNVGDVTDGITGLENRLASDFPRAGLITSILTVINQYQQKLLFTQIPLFLIVAQISAIILYYLVTVANMLIDRQAGEIALLRSRGASTRQIVGIYFIEGLIISAIGAAVGPFLGALIFSPLGLTGSFSPLTGGELLPIRFSGTVFVLAIVAAVLCLVAILVPAVQAARRSVVYQRQQVARPSGRPFWQRYYLDLAFLALGVVLYWELRQRGTLLTIGIFEGMGIDPLLLVTPILLLTAVAIVFLRLFPIIISLATKLNRYISNTSVVLGLWYMARNPVHYGRLILLLMMAASVGMFSATFINTLERSYNERAMYSSGSDVRLEALDNLFTRKDALQQEYSGIPGVEEVSMAYRVDGSAVTNYRRTNFTLLAVDPVTLSEVAWYRDDFADQPFQELMNLIGEDKPIQQGLALADGTEAIGVWVYPMKGYIETRVCAKIRNGLGHYIDYELGSIDGEGWQYFEAKLTTVGFDTLPLSPLSLICLYISENIEFSSLLGGVYFDDLQVRGSFSSEPVVIEDFEDVGEWTVLAGATSRSFSSASLKKDKLSISNEVVHNGTASAQFTWERPRGTVIKGISPNMDTRPLVVVASRSFMDNIKVSEGDLIQLSLPRQSLNASIGGVIDYFPTLDPAETGFLIANIDRLYSLTNLLRSIPINPNETWLTVTDDTEQRAVTVGILDSVRYGAQNFYDKDAIILNLRTDPLAGAGWSGMLMIAFLGVILVSSLGFVVYSYLSAQGQQLDFVILRTQGFSLRQIVGLVCFEKLFIIIVGIGLGTIIGERLSYVMIPFLQLTERGERVLPSFVLTTNWGTIGIAYIILAAAFIITTFLVILFFSRVAIYRTLRMGEL
ncbi:FtsX-like permease family protein [Chloroflexota bacterium]